VGLPTKRGGKPAKAVKPVPPPTLSELQPMLLSEVARPFSRASWASEIKFDGCRCLPR
jgi:ATP-dependent DNA ligase